MQRILFNFQLALEGVGANKLRGFLTALGIVFGVAAVIAMMAIGTGAKQAILEQMRLIGTNNIVLTSLTELPEDQEQNTSGSGQNSGNGGKRKWSPGLTLDDLEVIREHLPGVSVVSPEIVINTSAIYGGKLRKARCIGVDNAFFELNNLELSRGQFFHPVHSSTGESVCIIGKNIQTYFFPQGDPVGQLIKCGNVWLRVIGVLDKRLAASENLSELGIRDLNDDIYVPLHTALIRFENRSFIRQTHLGGRRGRNNNQQTRNYHQVDRATIQMDDSEHLRAGADYIARMLKRRHREVLDVQVEVPELLLQQQQKTQETFNMVLAVIAGISLLVGGIGIMNIMLASVLERIKEIGVRRSMGAYRSDIIYQFLFESVFISLLGGLCGVLLGVVSARLIASSADIPTIITPFSIVISFGVAASVGLIFGIIPARRAARQDPIKALRTE